MHVVDGLKEGEYGAVVGDTTPTHVIALHAVQEGGHGILQSFEELLMVLLRFSVLVLLLREERRKTFRTFIHGHVCVITKRHNKNQSVHLTLKMYLHYVNGLDRGEAFHWLADWYRFSQWHRSRSGRGGTLADFLLLFLPVSPVQITGQLEKMTRDTVITVHRNGCMLESLYEGHS